MMERLALRLIIGMKVNGQAVGPNVSEECVVAICVGQESTLGDRARDVDEARRRSAGKSARRRWTGSHIGKCNIASSF